ncbi:MAG: 3D-(3,5/4)-trihydroxycyclohexane-1,2-dione acylhydrolase (decyclizing) [Fusobacteria bacterium]|nr:3D-(3,5/4)-trihydroxycyclohexane-1,2-dione acylhydrolase (decyclizing) [Fusobacteriota bacterium]
MSNKKMTVAQALVKFINNQYLSVDGEEWPFVNGIFTIFGHGNVLGLGQALEEDSGHLHVLQGRNEQGMGHAAIGFAKQNKRHRIYACTSSVGPGAANMVTAAATATANRIPVLFLPGDVFATRQPDPVLQQIEQFHDLSISTNDAFRAVSKYWDRITRPEQLMSAAINAFRVLTDPENTGAVTICLPQDVQAECYDYPEYFFRKRIWLLERTPPTVTMLENGLELILKSKHPLIICGGGVKYSAASKELQTFSEKFNIPIAETQAGKSAIIGSYHLNLGGIGTTGNLAANIIAKNCDLVIGIGTRYTDFTTGSKSLFQNENVKFLNINISNFDALKLDATMMRCDAKVGLTTLMKELEIHNYCSGYINEISDVKEKWKKELERLNSIKYEKSKFIPEVCGQLDHVIEEFVELTGSSLTQTQVIGIINEFLDETAIIVGASGSIPGDLQRMWCAKGENSYHMEYGYSCMGYEVNAALGVKLAVGKQREVYSMVGDGAYQMLHSELVTSIQENQKINIILFDNMAFGCINNLQMGNGMGSYGTEFRYRDDKTNSLTGKLQTIDYAMSAKGYGCETYSVRNVQELKNALESAKKSDVSTLIDIKVLPKTMTSGYESWWHAGVAHYTNNTKINSARTEMDKFLKNARKY